MFRAESRRRAGGLVLCLASGALAPFAGCGGSNPNVTPAAIPPPKPATFTGTPKIALIRLNDPASGDEPSDEEISAGLKQSGVEPSSVRLVSYDCKGDPSAVGRLIDVAEKDGAALLMTFAPETTVPASKKGHNAPLVFGFFGEPAPVGLARNDADHGTNVTGVYTPYTNAVIVPIARGCLPRAKAIGILFNPDNPFSVAHKDALLKTEWNNVAPVTGEYHSESEISAAVRALVEQKKAEGVILVAGIGRGSKAAIDAARQAKVPVFGFLGDHALQGAIVARPIKTRWNGFEAGRRAGRVLRGESPKQLTLLQGDNCVTWVNPGAAKEIGVTILGALMRDPITVTTGGPDPTKAKEK
jgi:putative ABC transport system substrate-binding protein